MKSTTTTKGTTMKNGTMKKARAMAAANSAAVPEMREALISVEAFLLGLSRLCPTDEGLGGHAPIQAFIAKGIEGRNLLDDVRKHLANIM
jgi:hypothetical protein